MNCESEKKSNCENVTENISDYPDVDAHSNSIDDDCDTEIYNINEDEENLSVTGDKFADVDEKLADSDCQVKKEVVGTTNPSPEVRCFSPLPSTSNDNVIINLNNEKFNEAVGVHISPVNSPSPVDTTIIKEEKKSCENKVALPSPLIKSEGVIECSSDSDDDNIPVINLARRKMKTRKQRKKKPSDVINLLLDDEKIYDSDCEIVDVDQLIAQNNAILNKPSEVINLDDTTSYELPHSPPELEISHSPSELLTSHNHSSRGTSKKFSTLLETCESILNSFFNTHFGCSDEEQKNEDVKDNTLYESIVHLIPSITIPDSLQNSPNNQLSPKKRKSRVKPVARKRPKVLEYIDLSDNPKPQQISEVIELDLDTSRSVVNPVAMMNAVNPVQCQVITTAIETQYSSPITPYNHQLPTDVNSSLPEVLVPVSNTATSSMPLHPPNYIRKWTFTIPGSKPGEIPVAAMAPLPPLPPKAPLPPLPPKAPKAPVSTVSSPPVVRTRPPVTVTSDSPSPSRNNDCPICLETFTKGNVVSTLCGHIFCELCMLKVKATSKKCPTCRKALRGKGYHPIFL